MENDHEGFVFPSLEPETEELIDLYEANLQLAVKVIQSWTQLQGFFTNVSPGVKDDLDTITTDENWPVTIAPDIVLNHPWVADTERISGRDHPSNLSNLITSGKAYQQGQNEPYLLSWAAYRPELRTDPRALAALIILQSMLNHVTLDEGLTIPDDPFGPKQSSDYPECKTGIRFNLNFWMKGTILALFKEQPDGTSKAGFAIYADRPNQYANSLRTFGNITAKEFGSFVHEVGWI